MRFRNLNLTIICSFLLLFAAAGCGEDPYTPLVNPPDIDDPGPGPGPGPEGDTFTVYNYLEDAPEVNVSTVWEVTLATEDNEEKCMVFQSTTPEYDPTKGMIAADQKALGFIGKRSISWANFSFEGEVTVTAKIIDPAKVPMATPIVVYPSRRNVSASGEGTSVTFTLTEPGQYSVEVGADGYKNGLMIFANPPETDVPDKTNAAYKVLENATAADVASIPGNYSGLYFEKGVHDIGIFKVPSHIKHIYIPGDAYVFGTIRMIDNPGVTISGRGTLSAAHLPYRASHSIEAIRDGGAGSDGTKVKGIIIADYTHFSVRLISANNEVEWVKIIGCWTYNCDGISVFDNSTVKNCFIWANDDNIKPYANNVKFEDIVCWQLTNGNVIQMAWNNADPKNVTVSRVDLLHADWNNNEFNRGILGFIGNHYETAGNDNRLANHLIEDLVTETPVQVVWRVSPEKGFVSTLDGLTMKNWNVKQLNNGYKNYMYCSTEAEPFKGIVFDNVVFNGTKLTAENWITLTNMQTQYIETPTFK